LENPTTALLFSGGRNSLVLLHILTPYLDDIVVIWCNTGAAYESTRKQMDQIRSTVPHFFEVTSDQPGDIEKFGWPTDILPLRHILSEGGNLVPTLQTTYDCCRKNIGGPIGDALKEKGISLCYSGKLEAKPVKIENTEFKFPLGHWTKKMVQDYVEKHNIMVPPYYHDGEEKSRECWSCTGFLWERRVAINHLPFYQKEEVMERLAKIKEAITKELENAP
jgi:3'-phosphoadenosine 5'-phosphosulfate sulfotransferase (PAPS reductase)/FAD synthetase